MTDFILETVIRNGLSAIRSNNARLDDLFSSMTETYLNDKFGQTEIDRIKTWINANRINIVQAFPLKPSDMPCISITLQAAVEATELASLNDYAEKIEEDETPTIKESFTVVSYNSTTGWVSVGGTVDLSDINILDVFLDSDTPPSEYAILGGINNTTGSKGFFIDVEESPVITGTCKIVSNLDFSRATYNMVPIHEKIRIGIHTENAVLTKYLYYIIIYILQVRRDTMIRRWLELTHFSSSDFVREAVYLPENVFSRWIVLDAITRLIYKEEDDDLADGTGIIINVEREVGTTPRINESDFTVRTVEEDE